MELAQGQVGPEISYDLKFEGMKLSFEIKRKGALGDEEGMYGALPADAVLNTVMDGIEKLIPGDQKAMFEMAKAFLASALPK